jgi:Tol biopolymer transport system component
MKPIRGGLLLAAALLLLALSPATSWAAYPGANGLIAYAEFGGESSDPPPGGDDGEIFTIPPAGGDPTQLTDNSVGDYGPSWSADGRKIAFVRSDGHDWEVWTMSADGSHQRQVTHTRGHEWAPSFTPSGGRIIMSFNSRAPSCP